MRVTATADIHFYKQYNYSSTDLFLLYLLIDILLALVGHNIGSCITTSNLARPLIQRMKDIH